MSEEDKPIEKKKCYNGYNDFFEKMSNITPQQRVGIFTHRSPDPDALASMMGMAWLLQKKFSLESDLFYEGEIAHPQNQVMSNLLAINLKKVSDEYNDSLYGVKILVDTIPENAGVGKNQIVFDIVIDHHRDLPSQYCGIMIHRRTGSCSSIIFDMMKHFVEKEDWFDTESADDCRVATALITGIVTDTEYMMSDDSTDMEFKAFQELFPFRNPSFLKEIVFFKRQKYWIEKMAKASVEVEIDDNGLAIVGLGIIPEKQRDLISEMAQYMVSWASVETAIAFAVVGGDKIQGSVRSLDASLTISDVCKKLAGKHGTGGGKLGKGAYKLPLAGFSIDPDEELEDIEEAWASIKKREIKRIQRQFSA